MRDTAKPTTAGSSSRTTSGTTTGSASGMTSGTSCGTTREPAPDTARSSGRGQGRDRGRDSAKDTARYTIQDAMTGTTRDTARDTVTGVSGDQMPCSAEARTRHADGRIANGGFGTSCTGRNESGRKAVDSAAGASAARSRLTCSGQVHALAVFRVEGRRAGRVWRSVPFDSAVVWTRIAA